MSDLGEAPSSRFDALGFQSFKSDLRQRSLLTVSVATLNAVLGLTELEEAWLCRARYREHRLTRPEIGARLGRHKSWVCRRLTLVAGLHEQLQIDVRLGLLAPRAAYKLARLPHGSQPPASVAAQLRGMTVA